MSWFGRKKKEESIQIEQLQKDVASMSSQLEEMAESVTKLTRVQFKAAKKTEEKLDSVEAAMASAAEWKTVIAQKSQLETEQEIVRKQLMEHLDELDHVLSGISVNDQKWKDVLLGWSKGVKRNLETLGAYEVRVLGTSFDPRIAESVRTVSESELHGEEHLPYEIVEVYKRAFATKNGQLIRKAIVATVKEDSGNVSE